MFFVEDDFRDAFFVGVAVVVGCLFTFSQSCSPHTQWTMADKFVPDSSPQLRKVVDLQTDVSRDLFPGIAGHLRVLVLRQWRVIKVVILSPSVLLRGPYSFFLKSSLVSAGIIGHETGNVTPEGM